MSAVLVDALDVRPMLVDELDLIADLERAIYPFPWTLGNFRDSLLAGYRCVQFHDETGLVGYAVLMGGGEDAHLLNLSVVPARQGRGYGKRMLESLMREAQRLGAVRMLLEVRPSNAVARALYGRAGFAAIGVRRAYYPAGEGREDALVLARPL